MFKKGDKVTTKPHTRFWSEIPGNATLVTPQPTSIPGGRRGTVNGLLDNGDGTVSVEVRFGRSDFREFAASELDAA